MKRVAEWLLAPFRAVAALVAIVVLALGWKKDGEE